LSFGFSLKNFIGTIALPDLLPPNNWFSVARLRFPELLDLYKPEAAQHLVQFYDDEVFVIKNVSYLATKVLNAGDSAVMIGTRSHLEQIAQQLLLAGLNLDRLGGSGRYVTLDAAGVLSRIMVEDGPDEIAFERELGAVIGAAAKRSTNSFVFAYGEMVALLCAAGKPQCAVSLERLWNNLAKRQPLSFYCTYPLSSLSGERNVDLLLQICAEHALIIPPDRFL
jgi:hypothetical protein